MYEFVPAPGTRISKIANLANDLAMSLAAQRGAHRGAHPGQGRGRHRGAQRAARDGLLQGDRRRRVVSRQGKSPLALALGKDIVGAPVTVDLAKMPHLLVAGATGSGKSVSINAMICSLLLRSTPGGGAHDHGRPQDARVRRLQRHPAPAAAGGDRPQEGQHRPALGGRRDGAPLPAARRHAGARHRRLQQEGREAPPAGRGRAGRGRGRGAPDAPSAGQPVEEAAPSKILVVRKNEDGSEEPLLGAPEAMDAEARPAPGDRSAAEPSAAPRPSPSPSRSAQPPRKLPRRCPTSWSSSTSSPT